MESTIYLVSISSAEVSELEYRVMPKQRELEGGGEQAPIHIREALQTLPLFDDLYLRMQALNLDVVDAFLMDMERDLLREYMEKERTPVHTATFVSALSQLWIFGIYELLRTWRQRARELLRYADELRTLNGIERDNRLTEQKRKIENAAADPMMATIHWPAFERVSGDDAFVKSISRALDRIERLFRRIEALRVSLAKHEVPKIKGSFALAPGYGRIDMVTGSIYWQVVLRGNEVDIVSRRAIADASRELAKDWSTAILPKHIQAKMENLPEHSYGVKRVTVILEDKTEYRDAFIAWNREVLLVRGSDGIPFDASKIVDVRDGAG